MATAKLTAVVQTKGAKKSSDDLKRFSKSANDADGNTNKLSKGNKKLSLSFRSLAGPIGAVAKVATVAATALSAFTVITANANRELELLARQAGTTAIDFRALAFATTQYGINAEQIADISKDVADKVGEFATAGTGAFQDYADVLGLTKEEAVQVAKEFQGLGSQEVIGRVAAGLESVNATAGQTTFVLESLGNDLSRLAPLFASNSSELNTLKNRFNEVNGSLALTAGQSAGLQQLTSDYSLFTSSLKSSASLIAATLAPAVSDFFVGVTNLVPAATQSIVDFFNVFISAENLTSISAVEDRIESLTNAAKGLDDLVSAGAFISADEVAVANEELSATNRELEVAKARLEELTEAENKLADARKINAQPIAISGGGSFGTVDAELKAERELSAKKLEEFARFNESELEAVDRREQERVAIIESYRNTLLEDDKEYQIVRNQIEEEASRERLEIAKKEADKQALIDKAVGRQRRDTAEGVLADLETIGGKETKAFKAAAKVNAVVKTYEAANSAYASLASIPYIGPALGAAAAGVAISAGLANVRAIDGAREQGGQFSPGQNILVGERGPEVVQFPSSGRVRNQSQMQQGQGQPPPVNLVIIDQSEGKKEFDQSTDDDGRIVLLIRSTVSADIGDPNSEISKGFSGSTNLQRAGR